MMKVKTTEIPNSAKHLFIQLYCEKKGGNTNENIHKAAQSWLSLSLTKKKHFYDTISNKAAIKKAQRIIQTEPYLRPKFSKNKKIDSSICHNIEEPESEHNDTNEFITSMHDDMDCDNSSNPSVEENNTLDETLPVTAASNSECNTLQERVEQCILEQVQNEPQICNAQNIQNSYMNIVDEDTDSIHEDSPNTNNAENCISIIEPTLPTVKSGKELFELLKVRNGIDKAYTSLTTTEKVFYGKAALAIKKDYVNKYKEYLESLSPRQLFDYYKKIFL